MAGSLRPLVEQVRALVVSARHAATANIDTLQVLTNFEIGRLIVEHEQHGTARAEYGEYVLKELSNRLTAEFGRGFSKSNLEYMRRFFLVYQDRHPAIAQTLSGQLPVDGQPRPSPAKTSPVQKGRNQLITIAQTLSGQFTLSWSHYVFLLGINDPSERSFYEIESHQENWSLTEIKRQFDSGLYERLALSRDKKRVRKLAQEGHKIRQPADILKEPYILDFLGLEERPIYSESDLETAIIDKLQHFLLELGKGFLFEARQKRFTFGEDHYFVDLVFYNRLLRCYVLLDLKIGRLTHQDLGQMQMYVNHYDRDLKQPEENPTIGIILCKKKNEALVKITLPKKANIFASEYQLYLPSKEDLKQRLLEWTSSPV
ncbi:MAG TPA: PDDEXK nuclease domain-containing protein [Gemmataceae bacterium]|nr:PDDEXK nuclease domain-containing protein [Gemmataceae bacterium]